MLSTLQKWMARPQLYAAGTANLWDDEHISKGMLEAHLNPEWDAATRNHAFVRRSVQWIAQIAPPAKHPRLLDLGCGPGIYAELFHAAGYQVTGMDLSPRSIEFARRSAQEKQLPITYCQRNYLTLDYANQFDLATLIYCDFGVLSTADRALLLKKIYTALTPGGMLIFDAFTPEEYRNRPESKTWSYTQSGFYSPEPYLCLNSLYAYEQNRTFCSQHLVLTEQKLQCYNVWEHVFTQEELKDDLAAAGFSVQFYGDIAGAAVAPNGNTLCVVAQKAQ